MRPVLGPGFKISDQVPSSFKTCLRLNAYPGVVIILKKGAARGLRGARPSSAFQLLLVADCEETEYHGRGRPCVSRCVLLAIYPTFPGPVI